MDLKQQPKNIILKKELLLKEKEILSCTLMLELISFYELLEFTSTRLVTLLARPFALVKAPSTDPPELDVDPLFPDSPGSSLGLESLLGDS